MNPLKKITPAQKKILKDICYIQLKSLLRIKDDKSASDIDLELMLALNEIDKDEFKSSLLESISKYEKLHEDPHQIDNLTDSELSVIKHILNHVDHLYKDKYPNAVKNLWKRLFILTDYQTVLKILQS